MARNDGERVGRERIPPADHHRYPCDDRSFYQDGHDQGHAGGRRNDGAVLVRIPQLLASCSGRCRHAPAHGNDTGRGCRHPLARVSRAPVRTRRQQVRHDDPQVPSGHSRVVKKFTTMIDTPALRPREAVDPYARGIHPAILRVGLR